MNVLQNSSVVILAVCFSPVADKDWKAVTKDIKIEANLQLKQLQIKTDYVAGSNKQLSLYFYDNQGPWLAGGLKIVFFSQIKYWISFCEDRYIPFPTTPTKDQDKVWSFLRTKTGLEVECNGVLVLEYNTSLCIKDHDKWGREIKQIEFTSDSASGH